MATTDLRAATVLPPSATFGTHEHIPNWDLIGASITDDGGPTGNPTTDRAYAVYLAALLIGQRTPEELATLADYLMTGTISEWRNG